MNKDPFSIADFLEEVIDYILQDDWTDRKTNDGRTARSHRTKSV
jgi:hypothetical protein